MTADSDPLPDFSSSELQRLSCSAFIPVLSPPSLLDTSQSPSPIFKTPQQCYLARDSKDATGFHSRLFTFVDFGARANNFLVACGVRSEPTVDELAKILIANPRNFYELAGGFDRCIASFVLLNCQNLS